MAGKLIKFWESNSQHSPQFSYRRDLVTCDALLTLSHHLHVALNKCIEGRLMLLDFSAAFNRVNYCGLLYKLRFIGVRGQWYLGVGGQFLSIVLELLSKRKQRVVFVGKVSTLVDMVSGVPQGSVIGICLCCTPSDSSALLGTMLGLNG